MGTHGSPVFAAIGKLCQQPIAALPPYHDRPQADLMNQGGMLGRAYIDGLPIDADVGLRQT